MIKIFLFLTILNIGFSLKAQYYFFEGKINKLPIELTLYRSCENCFTGIYLYKKYNSPIEFHGNLKNGTLTLYEIEVRHNWDSFKNFFTFSKFQLENKILIGKWENVVSNNNYPVELLKKYSFNDYDSLFFDSLELLQLESSKNEYFKLLLHKNQNDKATFSKVRVYNKKNGEMIQEIDLNEDFDRVRYDIVEVSDYNSDGIEDFSIKFYDYHGENPWGYCFIKKDDLFLPYENCNFKY